MSLPGTRLLAVARLWFDEPSIRDVFEPLVADWQRESLTATGWPARRTIDLRYGLASAGVLFMMLSARHARTPPHWPAFATFTLIPACGLIAGWTASRGISALRDAALGMMASSAVAFVLPFALVPATMVVAQRSLPRHVRRRAALRMSSLAFLIQLAVVGFVTPSMVRTWNVHRFQAAAQSMPPSRSPAELTLPELMRPGHPAHAATSGTSMGAERHRRASLILAPLVLGLAGWSLGLVVGPARWLRAAAWWLIVGLLVVVVRAQWAVDFGRVAAEWLPLAMMLGLSTFLQAIFANNWHMAARHERSAH